MNANELREHACEALKTNSQAMPTIQAVVLFEIAAQLAELNEFLRRPAPVRGICRICGCTEFTPCIDRRTGEACGWVDEEETLCNSRICTKKAASDPSRLTPNPCEPEAAHG
jgi:hypothetical protein